MENAYILYQTKINKKLRADNDWFMFKPNERLYTKVKL